MQLSRPEPPKPSALELLHLLSDACNPDNGPVALAWNAAGRLLAVACKSEANVW